MYYANYIYLFYHFVGNTAVVFPYDMYLLQSFISSVYS